VASAGILLVEDDELSRTLVRVWLARSTEPALRDARLLEAGTLAQARTALMSRGFDIVLLDMHLPDGSGLSLAAELEQLVGLPRPAVVALSGAAEQERSALFAAGCTAVLSKPYTAADLYELLTAHLPQHCEAKPSTDQAD
jgi:two-component system, OmpR family, KDP operon response regulator KdpE